MHPISLEKWNPNRSDSEWLCLLLPTVFYDEIRRKIVMEADFAVEIFLKTCCKSFVWEFCT